MHALQTDTHSPSMTRRFSRAVLWTSGLGALFPFLVVAFNRLYWRGLEPAAWDGSFVGKLGLLLLGGVLTVLVVRSLVRGTGAALERAAREQGDFLDTLADRWVDWSILGTAGLSLFLELTMIRWQATLFPLFAFYKNFVLLACFAGLGLGYALSGRRHVLLAAVLPLSAFQIVLFSLLGSGLEKGDVAIINTTPVIEQLGMVPGWHGLGTSLAIYTLLGLTFMLTSLAFLPLGQVCGRLMERRTKLRAYGLNLLGSLLGVGLVFVLSFLWTPPAVWFAVAFFPLLLFQGFRRDVLVVGTGCAFLALSALVWPSREETDRIYSPYQLIEASYGENGLMELRAGGWYYQRVHDLSLDNANRAEDPRLASIASYYELPYRVHPEAGRVAIVGAGTGNDVAAALRMNAGRIDAIEIDPVIAEMGEAHHPEHPYDDPRVNLIVDDARSFFRRTHERYDLVVFGLLDSHAILSHGSSVRMDSFVYTVEALREARGILKDGGMLCLSFSVMRRDLGCKIFRMMKAAFDGKAPACVRAGYDEAIVFLSRKGEPVAVPGEILAETGFEDVAHVYDDPSVQADLSTDDWPFFYMPRRVYPLSYLPMVLLVLALSLGQMRAFLRREGPRRAHAPFFFLGAGFMLIETRAITELGLTFGNTWHVIGVAIVGILAMGFLANAAVARYAFRSVRVPYLLLFAALAVGYVIARSGGFPPTAWGRIGATVAVTCPMFFSGIVFSALLRSGGDISGIMAANLMGAMVGGCLEYNSMYLGFSALYLLGMGLYAMAFASGLRRSPVSTVRSPFAAPRSVRT